MIVKLLLVKVPNSKKTTVWSASATECSIVVVDPSVSISLLYH